MFLGILFEKHCPLHPLGNLDHSTMPLLCEAGQVGHQPFLYWGISGIRHVSSCLPFPSCWFVSFRPAFQKQLRS